MKKLWLSLLAISGIAYAQVQIGNLPPATLPLSGTEKVAVAQTGTGCPAPGCTRQTSVSNFAPITVVPVPALQGGTGEAGTITGVPYANGTAPFTAATGAQIATPFTGCSVGNPLLSFTGACVASSGGGTTVDLLSDQHATGTMAFSQAEYQVFTPSSLITIVNYTGGLPGYVDGIEYALDSTDTAAFNSATVNVYIDGSGTPSITVPAPQFFQSQYLYGNASGSAFSNAAFQNRFFAANTGPIPGVPSLLSGTFTCMLPIPFTTGVRITVNNGSSSATARVFWHVKLQTNVPDTWPSTRKLRMAYTNLAAPTVNTPVQMLNVLGTGRYVGLWFLDDDVPNSLVPNMAALEGDWQLYVDAVSNIWVASTSFSLGNTLIDSNGNEETVTTAGTSGGTQPTWARAAGATTTDGSVTWTLTPGQPTNFWIASRPYVVNMSILDPNGFVQRVTTAGTSGATQPSWNVTPGGTTTDNGITWTNQGSTYLHASWMVGGTEEYFSFGGYYFLSVPGLFTNNGYVGTTFGNWGGSPTHTNGANPASISAYRFHTVDPIRFNSQITLMWHVGDSSEVTWTSGAPEIWTVVYYYLQ